LALYCGVAGRRFVVFFAVFFFAGFFVNVCGLMFAVVPPLQAGC
jgi:hypothetical protein